MPYWLEFNQMRNDSDIDILDEFRSFKKLKVLNLNCSLLNAKFLILGSIQDFKKSATTTGSKDDTLNLLNDTSIKWRYNQYVKALNTQLML